jgi:hypothetical protein
MRIRRFVSWAVGLEGYTGDRAGEGDLHRVRSHQRLQRADAQGGARCNPSSTKRGSGQRPRHPHLVDRGFTKHHDRWVRYPLRIVCLSGYRDWG